MACITTVRGFLRALRGGPHIWPGGYPIYFVCADGEPLSFEAAAERANKRLIADEISTPTVRGSWHVVAVEINWEDQALYCSHTGKLIPAAYGDE